MKRTAYCLALLLSAAFNTGCAGLKTEWRLQLQMLYSTPDDVPSVTVPPPLPAGKPA